MFTQGHLFPIKIQKCWYNSDSKNVLFNPMDLYGGVKMGGLRRPRVSWREHTHPVGPPAWLTRPQPFSPGSLACQMPTLPGVCPTQGGTTGLL